MARRSVPLGLHARLECEQKEMLDEMGVEELVSTGTFQKGVPHHARVLDGSEDGELVTFYEDDGEKQ